MSRIDAIQRVVGAVEHRDFSGVSEDDLALADNASANRMYRDWVAGGWVPLPDDEGLTCNDDVLVKVVHVTDFDGHHRIIIDHHVHLQLQQGDLIYIRRRTPVRAPERRR